MDDDEPQEFGLVLAFDSDSEDFTRGFEIGSLWEKLGRDGYARLELAHASNAEMFMRCAEAKGLPFKAEPIDDEWMSVTIGTPVEQEA